MWFRRSRPPREVNLLELMPQRRLQWEEESDGRVVLLLPRFERGPLASWLMPRLKRPFIRLRLDALGSLVWRLCDGETRLDDIALKVKEAFGDDAEPLYERMGQFVQYLEREEYLFIPFAPSPSLEVPSASAS